MDRRTLLHGFAAAGATGLMGAIAGCTSGSDGGGNGDGGNGGGNGGGGADTTADGSNSGDDSSTAATVVVSSVKPFGNILTDSEGMTLYLFTKDKSGKSVCYGECAAAWPPLLVENEPTAGNGVTTDLGTITRKDGSKQVTAAGNPLYYYTPDKQPGDTKGQGVGGVWYVLAPDGSKITGKATATDTGEHTHGETQHHGQGMGMVPDGPTDHADVAMLNTNGGTEHHFAPHVVWVKKGGTVTWTLKSGAHSTTAYHPDNDKPLRIPKKAESWDSGVLTNQGKSFEHTFAVAGVYDYFCIPHEAMGMLGSVIVGHPDPTGQPALEPPQKSLPKQAQAKITELNAAVTKALDTPSTKTEPAGEETTTEGTTSGDGGRTGGYNY